MKRLLFLLFLIPFISLAQVPQGVGYQGVATDANGIELVNQSISIRASVLSGSANGTIEWEETHATSTDTFGLFALTIGQGTNTTNGAQTSFADISWGTNTHFLKIEMDVTGGSNYSFMGTNQMMSVPYALFAESANINYDSISNFLSGDSTFITNVGGGMGGGGCDFLYPDGLDGEGITLECSLSLPYTVPLGKRLYLMKGYHPTAPIINGLGMGTTVGGKPVILNAGDTLTSNPASNFNGYLVDENSEVLAITEECSSSLSYTVPLGKRLYVMCMDGGTPVINGLDVYLQNGLPLILNAGDVLTTYNNLKFNGYLVDENYFANCGGGGGSSGNSNSNTSGSNSAIGVGSAYNINDFDKEYNMFDAKMSGSFGNFEFHSDQNNNTYITGQYSMSYLATVGDCTLTFNSSAGESIFLAKFDSNGVIQFAVSEPWVVGGNRFNCSTIDANGNIIIIGKRTYGDYLFANTYDGNNGNIISTFNSSSTNSGPLEAYDVVSDGSGGCYVGGKYSSPVTFGTFNLVSDANSSHQGFIFHLDNNNIITWADYVGDINLSGSYDFVTSLAIDQNDNLLAGGLIEDGSGCYQYKTFIKQYSSTGTLLTTLFSDPVDYPQDWNDGIEINVDNNGDIYLFTSAEVNSCNPNYVFNSAPLNPVFGNSNILYKIDPLFSHINAVNFGNGALTVKQIEILSNNDIVLRTESDLSFFLNNILYSQDISQYNNITQLNTNFDFVKFHTLGNDYGYTRAEAITSNNTFLFTLYNREGPFINNGTTYPSGYYVVREQY